MHPSPTMRYVWSHAQPRLTRSLFSHNPAPSHRHGTLTLLPTVIGATMPFMQVGIATASEWVQLEPQGNGSIEILVRPCPQP